MGWFGKKQASPSHPSGDRYRGKPLLILLENYVLSCIGCLPPEKATALISVVQRVYGGGDDWKATLRSTLHLGDALDENVKQMWLPQPRNREGGECGSSARGVRPHGGRPELLIIDRLSPMPIKVGGANPSEKGS
jgi:hypothetical protein